MHCNVVTPPLSYGTSTNISRFLLVLYAVMALYVFFFEEFVLSLNMDILFRKETSSGEYYR
jgi:hypothetical protein